MTEVTTSFQKATSVSQSGSLNTWSDIANLQQGGSGRAFCIATGGNDSNDLFFKIPNNFGDIPEGAGFVSMRLQYTAELQAASPLVSGRYFVRLSPSQWSGTFGIPTANTGSATFFLPNRDRSEYGLTAFTPSQIISMLKDGSLYFTIKITQVNSSSIPSPVFFLENVRIELTYSVPIGRGGAIIAATV